ncbi:MAG: hypothetical protein K2G89_09865 [Lachnospiraceae bacterium]|nr:hypothetical protein [Lachnospiraceae bacterium]
MAKKQKGQNENGEEKAGSKILSALIVLVIIAVWLAVLIALVRFDVGGFGSNVLRPVLKDVPVINKILPPANDAEAAKETDLPYTTLQQALDRIEELEAANSNLNGQVDDLNETISDKDKEIAKLKIFEENQAQLQSEKEAFYREIVYGENAPDADTYIKWYNSLDPEYAERIYRQVVAERSKNDEMAELAKTYAAMKPQEAATILETMTKDLNTVADILSAMNAEQRGAIMGKMTAEFAANVTRKLAP